MVQIAWSGSEANANGIGNSASMFVSLLRDLKVMVGTKEIPLSKMVLENPTANAKVLLKDLKVRIKKDEPGVPLTEMKVKVRRPTGVDIVPFPKMKVTLQTETGVVDAPLIDVMAIFPKNAREARLEKLKFKLPDVKPPAEVKTTILDPRDDIDKFVFMVIIEWEPQHTKEMLKRMRDNQRPKLPGGWEIAFEYCALEGNKRFKLIRADRKNLEGWDPLNPGISSFFWSDIAKVTVIPVIHVDLLNLLNPSRIFEINDQVKG